MKLTDGSDSFVIRIYRYVDNHSRRIVGTAEKVGEKEKHAFTNVDELWDILNPLRGEEGQKGKERKT